MSVSKKKPKCAICRKEYSPECSFNQGRCPHHPPVVQYPMSLYEKIKFFKDINFFKRKN
ncbi:hypothetical protein UFOVP257_315 [uncultured Caudovirales phage]|uniref:Uncharacterized protein n=1 Tax=uncultured Caudovirales phage TaxID=2100421 RepID=A0A6J5LJS4_9CAUD|nr:hypothetical protein UFOVP257_315 [uncultured Caudovirales phage]